MDWFKFHTDFHGDPVVQSLAFEDQRHFVVLLCLKAEGTLDRINARTRDRIVARGLGLDQNAAGEARRRLIEVGLIGEDWQPVDWDKHQVKSAISTPRVRKCRKNKETGNVSETFQKRFTAFHGNESETDDPVSAVKAKASPVETVTQQAFRYWCLVMGKSGRTALDAKRKSAIQARLKEGYTLEDIRLAIDGCKLTPHNMGQNDNGAKYNDIELICRNAANLERFRDKAGEKVERHQRSDVL